MTWTLPNILTVLRLLAAPGVAVMFLYFDRPLADWLALILFVGAAITDWFDGHLARSWKQESKFGAMLDPIADKVMVVIALVVIVGNSGMVGWLVWPATMILFREVFVSGLREFLGAQAGLLRVTRLAKWKTTAQMVSIAVIFLGTGLEQLHLNLYYAADPRAYQAALDNGAAEWNPIWLSLQGGWYAGLMGIGLLWIAALLTLLTGIDYLRKALPFLREEPKS
ncbi:CDP-diacylglycerol--glycerol-3-phosphate 3-phosphatidyltransferase [Brevirhabdus sp.]|uniref:CDP-diacylglycerol--glycerol-3-phosphate 3-phosphatidyltransferase n=1 Tax=Brevirhabdus sp. TaxID=2004514 RepID=UPI00405A387F